MKNLFCGWDVVAAKFFWYLLFMFLTFTYFTFYGMMAVGLTPSQQLAAVISSAFYSIWNLFSGFLIPVSVSGKKPTVVLNPEACSMNFFYILDEFFSLGGLVIFI